MRALSLSYRSVFLAIAIVGLMLSGCGKDGSNGPPGPQGPQGEAGLDGPACVSDATALNITVDKVTMFDDPATANVEATPVVDFTVTNENGYRFCALTRDDLRFNIAKLTGKNATTGNPSFWQNYIIRSRSNRMEGSQERVSTNTAYHFGTLEDHLNGTYTYTFYTDLNTAQATCDATTFCTDADGNALDLSYEPTKTHRVGIQQGNRAYPLVNGTYDFVPDGSTVTVERDIVQTANCNECHNRLRIHGTRVETKFCVTCHNPGSWFAQGNTVGGVATPVNTTVDFKVFIHKIHRSEELHQLVGSPDGNPPYAGDPNQKYLGFEVLFPQDLRNCTKCHTGTDSNADRNTPQGDNWETEPSMEACGSCHDDIYFNTDQIDTVNKPWQNTPHPGGVPVTNYTCIFCHSAGGPAGTIASSHTIPAKVWRAKFRYNILEICGVAVGSNPVCTPGSPVTVKFSVDDPTGGIHGYGGTNTRYNIRSGGDPEFNAGGNSSLNIDFAWPTSDYNNTDGTGALPARAAQVNPRTSAYVTDDGTGIYTLNASAGIVVPDGTGLNGYSASGSGTVGMEGHPAGDYDGDGTYSDRVPAESEVAFFGITDTEPVPRRAVVDVHTKCDNCHDVLALHGSNRNNNAQICVLCHNPNNTDVSQRPKTAIADPANPQPGEGLPDASATLDGKKEESIDFKRMIHAIHGNSIREKSIVVYGYNGSVNDFGEVEFPGIVSDCHTCHLDDPADTMTLEDRSGVGGANWEQPAQNGILGSTIDSAPNATVGGIATGPGSLSYEQTLRADDLKISPTAAVCSSCHDDTVTQAHMENLGSALFGADPATVSANIEQCVTCHEPGALADVEEVHHEATERAKQGL